ncbi:cytochrome c3 family protein [Telmatospirillum sp.]|uniref:cytochrome c3 family protein n=1 Tax=Telmatospirillum sp. TaxID=2079197 RepID=UPI00283F6E7F|nr:cytochrome c3 family protein [Telmatospirillum sp.]MDR3437559.1 cytochrome c3 family protein [Telmatospirillum sp.]
MKKLASLACLLGLSLLLGTTAMAASDPQNSATQKPIVSVEHQDFKCQKCHGVDKPASAAPDTACKQCHGKNGGTYLGKEVDYQESGKTRTANMHDAHVGPVRCTVCHAIHSAPPQPLYCNNCHQYDVKAK